jgi:hypothetical protein
MARPRTQAEMAAAEAAAEESAARAERDAETARQVREHGDGLAHRIRTLNEANHFTRWLFRDGAGGTA